jgi:hypothetical protein
MRRLACAVALVAVVVAACSGGGDDAGKDDDAPATTAAAEDGGGSGSGSGGAGAAGTDAAAYVDALVTASTGNGMGDSPDQNRCFAQAYVDTVGVEALSRKVSVATLRTSTGVVPDSFGIEFTDAQRETFFDGLQACSDIKGYFVRAFTGDQSLTDADRACLTTAIDDEMVKTIVTAPFDGDQSPIESTPAFDLAMTKLVTACPEAMSHAGFTP